jgi:Domain of unknown function (DUF4189)
MTTFTKTKTILLAAGFNLLGFTGPAAAQDINPYGNDCSIAPNSAGCGGGPTPYDTGSYDTSPSSYNAPGGRFNIAWHKDSNNYWIAVNYPYLQDARRAAKKACNAAMGGGCKVEKYVSQNGYIIAYRYLDGTKNYTWGFTPEEAKQLMQQDCAKRKTECVIINSGDSRGQTRPMVIEPQGDFLKSDAAARPLKEER